MAITTTPFSSQYIYIQLAAMLVEDQVCRSVIVMTHILTGHFSLFALRPASHPTICRFLPEARCVVEQGISLTQKQIPTNPQVASRTRERYSPSPSQVLSDILQGIESAGSSPLGLDPGRRHLGWKACLALA
jgi:hypothetical protein